MGNTKKGPDNYVDYLKRKESGEVIERVELSSATQEQVESVLSQPTMTPIIFWGNNKFMPEIKKKVGDVLSGGLGFENFMDRVDTRV